MRLSRFDWLSESEEAMEADDCLPRDGYGSKLRDYDVALWQEVSALHRDGSHDLAEKIATRGNTRPIKPAKPIGHIVQSLRWLR